MYDDMMLITIEDIVCYERVIEIPRLCHDDDRERNLELDNKMIYVVE